MSTYRAFAQAAAVNIDWDAVRRNNILHLERELMALSARYKALKAAGDPEAAAVRLEGIELTARYNRALAREAR